MSSANTPTDGVPNLASAASAACAAAARMRSVTVRFQTYERSKTVPVTVIKRRCPGSSIRSGFSRLCV